MEQARWRYEVQLRNNCRIYVDSPQEPRYGVAWSLDRVELPEPEDGQPYRESIVTSAGVFETDAEAKRDAMYKLTVLALGSGDPLRSAIRYIIEG